MRTNDPADGLYPACWLVLVMALLTWPADSAPADTPAPFTDEEATEIAVEAHLYASPMVLMDATRIG